MEKKSEQAHVVLLPVDSIDASRFQARTVFDERELKKLAVSILQNGLLQPVSVRPAANGRYELIAGERRLRACRMIHMTVIPALIFHFADEKTAALSLLENLQREALNPFEQARALRGLLDLWHCTQEDAARRLGMAQPTLANKLRLLSLTPEQQTVCIENNLTERHARAVLRLPSCEQRTAALREAAARGFNVQQMDALVTRLLLPAPTPPRPRPRCKVLVNDVRLFVNSIDHAIHVMTDSGIPATTEKREHEDFIEYVVRIPTNAALRRRRSCTTRGQSDSAEADF